MQVVMRWTKETRVFVNIEQRRAYTAPPLCNIATIQPKSVEHLVQDKGIQCVLPLRTNSIGKERSWSHERKEKMDEVLGETPQQRKVQKVKSLLP